MEKGSQYEKNNYIGTFDVTLVMMMSGCCKTWSGVKQDTVKHGTYLKQAVHEATA